jgi:hypothetical protein
MYNLEHIYIARYQGNSNPIALNYNQRGELSIQLPQGPQSDSFRLYLFVNIIDDSLGVAVYNISTPVQVMPNQNLTSSLINDVLANNPSSPILRNLQSGNLNVMAKTVIGVASLFNSEDELRNSV